MNINKDHFYFTSNKHALYGMLFEPKKVIQRTENYLIIHPFAEEKKSSQKVLVDLAQSICEKGNYVFMFDLYGCGDSEGELKDANFSIWLDNLKQASFFLQEKTKKKDVNIIGLRLGAFLACVYSKNRDEINKLICIEPVLNPAKDLRRSLRSILMKELCTDGEISSNRNDLLANLENNLSIDFSGHEISSNFYNELLNYCEINPYEELKKRKKETLFINISSRERLTRQFQNFFESFGDNNLTRTMVIKMEPFWGQIDLPDYSELIQKIVDWCYSSSNRKDLDIEQLSVNGGDNKRPSVIVDQIPDSILPETYCLTTYSNFSFKESVFTIKHGNDKIFGVFTEPSNINIKGKTIIFLHGWAGYRIGPHRMIVDFARKLGELGFHCVRFDFRGKGFSPLEKGPDNKTQLSDLESVLNNIEQYGLPNKIILVGICSGARLALYYAMKGKKELNGIIELSTPLLRPSKEVNVELSRSKSLLNEYYKKALKRETWIKLLHNELKFRLIFRILNEPLMNSIHFLFRKKTPKKKLIRPRQNDAFLNFKGDILAIHAEKDPETEVALKQVINLANKYAVPLVKHVIKGANHSFYSIAWKNKIFNIIQGWLNK